MACNEPGGHGSAVTGGGRTSALGPEQARAVQVPARAAAFFTGPRRLGCLCCCSLHGSLMLLSRGDSGHGRGGSPLGFERSRALSFRRFERGRHFPTVSPR